MAAERIIGVDFGTSTSVIRVKRYRDGKPVDDRLEVKPVKFNSGTSEMVPTLIEKLSIGGEYYGYEAEIGHRNAKTFQNFKVKIENPDEDVRRQARELTAEFFKYLRDAYNDQSGYLGEPDDRLRTIISYPVKWSDETKAFLIRTAKDAGFPNVEGADEAQAAIQAVTVQNADLGYFQEGVPINILLIDMGAGTTDLVLCRHTPGEQPKTDTLCIWPKGGNVLFGGREVDELLNGYIRRLIPKESWDQVHKRVGIEQYKSWKEKIVSPALQRMRTVDEFTALDNRLEDLEIEIKYAIDRDIFEDFAADYLRQFPELVNGCLSAAGLKGDDVDLVILTGGHSRWYFVREMLSGELDRFGEISLKKIKADPKRIISISLPQETVALGLAYMPLKVEVFPLKYDPYSRIRPVIAAGYDHTVGVKKDGTVIAVGNNHGGSDWYGGACNVSDWRDIVTISAGSWHTVGLKRDGTVVAVGGCLGSQCDVSDWRDIVAVSARTDHTVGLKKDGTIVFNGSIWEGCKLSDWRDIVAIAAGTSHTVGLKTDGTLVTIGWNRQGQCNVNDWRDIVAIAAGCCYTVGLKNDGTVIAVGDNKYGQCDVDNWRDIVAIAAGEDHTVGLKQDGTAIAIGNNKYGQCNVSGWWDIVTISAGCYYTVGMKKDGTLVAVGNNKEGQTNVGKMGKLFY